MARSEIKIPMAVDTGGIAKEISNGLVEPLEDAEKALEALSKVDAGKDLENDLERAQKATDKLSDELDDTRDALRKLGHASKDAGDDAKRGMDRAKDGAEEFKDEANSTAREAAASFNGSAEDIGDAFQEVAANALAGFGPIGAAAGLALAAGLGIFMKKIEEATKKVEEIQQAASDISMRALESGVDIAPFMTSTEEVLERLKALQEEGQKKARWWFEEDMTGLQEFNKDLKKTGETAADAFDIFSLGEKDLKKYTDTVKDNRDALQDQINDYNTLSGEVGALTEEQRKHLDALNEEKGANDRVIETLEKEMETRSEAAERSSAFAESGVEDAQRRAEAITAAEETVTESVLSAYDSMRGAATDYATAEDGALDIGRWLTYTQEHAAAVATYQANLEQMRLSPDQWSNLMEMPEDARMQWVAQFVALPENARAPYAAALNDLGSSGGSEAAVGFDESFNPDADVEIQVDTAEAESALVDVSKKRTAEIEVKTTGKADAKQALDALAKKRHATIDVSADTSSASATVNSWRRSQESRPVYITVRAKTGGSQLV